jgi:hypothetical protein
MFHALSVKEPHFFENWFTEKKSQQPKKAWKVYGIFRISGKN